ncbi:MAG: rRNA maturation RNase YbeY, partial [Candidatus Nealsonbacteria bacterium]|nr:rRNA maturation RNase YbeY [Candidatus Nealsonbacteria bacterium]
SFLKDTAGKVLKAERIKKSEFSIAVVDRKTIKGINKKYRRKDKETDVLSFDYGIDLAEIIICPAVIKKNAKKLNLGYNKEITRALIHGVLHIAGYDHEKSVSEGKIMRQKTEKYLKLFK